MLLGASLQAGAQTFRTRHSVYAQTLDKRGKIYLPALLVYRLLYPMKFVMKANEVFRFETIDPGNTFLNFQVDPLQPISDFRGLSLLFCYY